MRVEDVAPGPPTRHVRRAVEMSTFSPCRSKRGVAIFRGQTPIASGYNFKPRGFDCDGSAECKATCRDEAIHAEQHALLCAGLFAQGSEMLHVKTVAGQLVPSGPPSCVQCSKLVLGMGIDAMWLYHATGWRRYPAAEFHALSLAVSVSPAAGRGSESDEQTNALRAADPESIELHADAAARAVTDAFLKSQGQ